MRAQGVPVMVSRFDSGHRAGEQALLVVAEPRLDEETKTRSRKLQEMLGEARRTPLVLPKWSGREDREHAGWLDRAELVPPTAVARAAGCEGAGGIRAADGRRRAVLRGRAGQPDAAAPPAPPPQRHSRGLRPLITCANGWLLAEWEDAQGRRPLVLSDPDVLSNHGLGKGRQRDRRLGRAGTTRACRARRS